MKLKHWLIVGALLIVGLIAGIYWSLNATPSPPANSGEPVVVTPNLSRFSIKDLPQVSTYTLAAEATDIPEILAPKVQGRLSQDFFGQSPLLINMNVVQYKTASDAQVEYDKLYGKESELGLRFEKDKEEIDLDGRKGKLSLIRAEENNSYITEVLVLDGNNLIRVATADLSKYFQDLAIQIAKEVVKKI